MLDVCRCSPDIDLKLVKQIWPQNTTHTHPTCLLVHACVCVCMFVRGVQANKANLRICEFMLKFIDNDLKAFRTMI